MVSKHCNKSIPQAAPETTNNTSTITTFHNIYNKNNKSSKLSASNNNNNSLLHVLPTDVVTHIVSYLSPIQTDTSIKLTCKMLWEVSNSIPLWKEYCFITGKLDINNNKLQLLPISSSSSHSSYYKELYYLNPCVPLDFNTIKEAIQYCTSEHFITLLPGTYYEKILIGNQSSLSSSLSSKKYITIKAAFSNIGATIAYYDISKNRDSIEIRSISRNQPCIRISGNNTIVTMNNIQILHSSSGSDIWGGNCACIVDSNASLVLNNCALQSDSGRGVVVTDGAAFSALNCNIHDCAATGLYVGDHSTSATITSSNIIRNGGGCRRRRHHNIRLNQQHQLVAQQNNDNNRPLDQNHNHHHQFDNVFNEGLFHDRHRVNEFNIDEVPPGHSGMYVESGIALVTDCMISGNSLTGLSVVRGGRVQLSACDITENGHEPISVEDAFAGIVGDENVQRGGIYVGKDDNNFESIREQATNESQTDIIIHGSRVRNINPAFIHSIYRPILEW